MSRTLIGAVLVGVATAVAGVAASRPAAASTAPAGWSGASPLLGARSMHTATLLSSGKVLVAGGQGTQIGIALSDAELYDPTTGAWSATGSMGTPRYGHTATLLADGRVLVAGGIYTNRASRSGAPFTATAELYDPATGRWSATGSMRVPREQHTATRLPDGRVLVVGGVDNSSFATSTSTSLTSVELYDPASGSWSSCAAASATASCPSPLAIGRTGHTASLLPHGRVLVDGGYKGAAFDPGSGSTSTDALATPELYDAATGTWAPAPDDFLGIHHFEASATVLQDGRVLIAGGYSANVVPGVTPPTPAAEIFDPGAGAWSGSGSLTTGRALHTATLLGDGRVLAAGGVDTSAAAITGAEIWSPATGHWSSAGSMGTARALQTATLLGPAACGNGCSQVLVAGGGARYDGSSALASAELYTSAASQPSAPPSSASGGPSTGTATASPSANVEGSQTAPVAVPNTGAAVLPGAGPAAALAVSGLLAVIAAASGAARRRRDG